LLYCFSRTVCPLSMRNYTSVIEFILFGIPNTQGLEDMIFVVFLTFYTFSLRGNLLIFLTILASSNLHTPMYFFLANLSVFDILFASVNSSKMMVFLLGQSRTISYQGCASQVFFYHTLGGTECFLYTMVYCGIPVYCDGHLYTFVAICHPIVLTFLTFRLPYCGPNRVHSFFCDIPMVLPLACADTSLAQMVSRHRAFSTCSAHLISILLAYGPVILVYLKPASSRWLDAAVQVLNNVVTPSLNPVIYSLRNKDVKLALQKVLGQVTCLLGSKE
uniref:G-protein coupled receptors family 1 profile domain-containing protein n=1 Tax=Cavia porcellus TaxID=10141 RepID=H0W5X2_CAVPO